MIDFLFGAFLAMFVTAIAVTSDTHRTIATECDKLGAFYVGDKVYECKRKE